jgi:hypothetical protein
MAISALALEAQIGVGCRRRLRGQQQSIGRYHVVHRWREKGKGVWHKGNNGMTTAIFPTHIKNPVLHFRHVFSALNR